MAISNTPTSIADIEQQIAKVTAQLEAARAQQLNAAEKAYLSAKKAAETAQNKVRDLNAKPSTTVAAKNRLATASATADKLADELAQAEEIYNALKAGEEAAAKFAKNVERVLAGKKIGKKIKFTKKEKEVLKEDKKQAKKDNKAEKKAAKEARKNAEVKDNVSTPVESSENSTETTSVVVKKQPVKKSPASKSPRAQASTNKTNSVGNNDNEESTSPSVAHTNVEDVADVDVATETPAANPEPSVEAVDSPSEDNVQERAATTNSDIESRNSNADV